MLYKNFRQRIALLAGGMLCILLAVAPLQAQINQAFVDALDLNPNDVIALDFGDSDPAGFGIFETQTDDFPREGSTYALLSNGDVSEALSGQQGTFLSGNLGGLSTNENQDLVQLRLRLRIPSGQRTLRFDWKYLSEEFPDFVGSNFNDAFLAEQGTSSFTR